VQNLLSTFSLTSEGFERIRYARVSFLPHQKGPYHALARWECTRNMETLMGMDFSDFLQVCVQKWQHYCAKAGIERDFVPMFWGWFTLPAVEKILKFFVLAFYQDDPIVELFEQMEMWSRQGKITKCQVYIRLEFFPLVAVPSSLSCSLLPI
jgi:hypothetical protein